MYVIASKDTGNYRLRLEGDEDGLVLFVTFTGPYSGGEEVEVWLESEEDISDEEAACWLDRHVRGDLDAMTLLLTADYDEYGTIRRGARLEPVRI